MKTNNKKANLILEYAVVIALIVSVLLAMSFYIRRAICGKWKSSADSFGYGQQYDVTGKTQITITPIP